MKKKKKIQAGLEADVLLLVHVKSKFTQNILEHIGVKSTS